MRARSGAVGVAGRRRDAGDDGVEQLGHPLAGLGRDVQDVVGATGRGLLDLGGAPLGVGGGQVDLVQHGDDLEVVLQRLVAVGQGLGLDPLGGVDQQHRPLAGGQRPADLVAEVDVARGVDEVQGVVLPRHPDVLGLDGDAPLPLDVHRVEVLLPHLAGVDRPGQLQDAVGQRRLAVVDVADDGEVADTVDGEHGAPSVPKAGRPPPVAVVRPPTGAADGRSSGRRDRGPVRPAILSLSPGMRSRADPGGRHPPGRRRQHARRPDPTHEDDEEPSGQHPQPDQAQPPDRQAPGPQQGRPVGAAHPHQDGRRRHRRGRRAAEEAIRLAIKRIDKAAAKGVIHKNQAANRKSRLMKRAAKASADA